jgi:hypothetical protein
MAKLIVDGPDLVVRLSPLEKLGALHRDVRTAGISWPSWPAARRSGSS